MSAARIEMFLKEPTTEIALGCEVCPNRKVLKFKKTAASLLLGTNTSGVPITAVERIQFENSTGSINLGGMNTVCEGGPCKFEEIITSAEVDLVRKSNSPSEPMTNEQFNL